MTGRQTSRGRRGVPVSSPAGRMPDVIRDGENGFLFNTNNPADAAHVLHHALNLENNQKEEIQQAAIQTINERFQPEMEINNIENAIKESD